MIEEEEERFGKTIKQQKNCRSYYKGCYKPVTKGSSIDSL